MRRLRLRLAIFLAKVARRLTPLPTAECQPAEGDKIPGGHLKLHLGCGDVHLAGFINVDIDGTLPAVDIVDNVSQLCRFSDGSVNLIYACHVLEHFAHTEVPVILKRWYAVLESGGELRISVPDLDRIVDIYARHRQHFRTPPNTPWIGLLYGGQTDPYDFHKTGFNFTWMKYLLEQTGYVEVEEYPHAPHWLGIQDASLANDPFGEYVSLNIRATKPGARAADCHSRTPAVSHGRDDPADRRRPGVRPANRGSPAPR